MSPTSEERQAIAEKLRESAKEGEYLDQSIVNAIQSTISANNEVYNLTFGSILADLIDPTCRTREYGRPDEFRVAKGCSFCGNGWYENIFAKPYQYCPWCGARVVSSDESKRIPPQDI